MALFERVHLPSFAGATGWLSSEPLGPAELERPSDLTRDDILDNITLFWLTNTGVSSTRLYWENKLPFFSVKGVKIPVGVSTFADELYRVPRSWAEQAYPNLVYYNQHDRGGHFAAWEQPQLLSEDVRATFRSLRTNGGSS